MPNNRNLHYNPVGRYERLNTTWVGTMSGNNGNDGGEYGGNNDLDSHAGNHFFYADHIDYDHLITASMHWLIRQTLQGVLQYGLPGEHHLYISFDTNVPDVDIPESLRQRYPDEMTIVLQNRFYDLVVGPRSFSVSLSFSRVLQRLHIPYTALTRFYDPSCGFVLQLGQWVEETQDLNQPEYASEQDQLSSECGASSLTSEDRALDGENTLMQSEEGNIAEQDKVVILDQFRKK